MNSIQDINIFLKNLFTENNFQYVDLPLVYNSEVFYETSGEDMRRRMFSFTNNSGDEMCLRPDLTIPLINYFPANTQTGFETEALPSIWEEKQLFNDLMNKASNDASDFATIVMNLMGDELKEYQKKMIWSQCKTCHDKFRMPH